MAQVKNEEEKKKNTTKKVTKKATTAETLSDEDIFKYIDESYQLTQTIHTKTKKDVIQ